MNDKSITQSINLEQNQSLEEIIINTLSDSEGRNFIEELEKRPNGANNIPESEFIEIMTRIKVPQKKIDNIIYLHTKNINEDKKDLKKEPDSNPVEEKKANAFSTPEEKQEEPDFKNILEQLIATKRIFNKPVDAKSLETKLEENEIDFKAISEENLEKICDSTTLTKLETADIVDYHKKLINIDEEKKHQTKEEKERELFINSETKELDVKSVTDIAKGIVDRFLKVNENNRPALDKLINEYKSNVGDSTQDIIESFDFEDDNVRVLNEAALKLVQLIIKNETEGKKFEALIKVYEGQRKADKLDIHIDNPTDTKIVPEPANILDQVLPEQTKGVGSPLDNITDSSLNKGFYLEGLNPGIKANIDAFGYEYKDQISDEIGASYILPSSLSGKEKNTKAHMFENNIDVILYSEESPNLMKIIPRLNDVAELITDDIEAVYKYFDMNGNIVRQDSVTIKKLLDEDGKEYLQHNVEIQNSNNEIYRMNYKWIPTMKNGYIIDHAYSRVIGPDGIPLSDGEEDQLKEEAINLATGQLNSKSL